MWVSTSQAACTSLGEDVGKLPRGFGMTGGYCDHVSFKSVAESPGNRAGKGGIGT